MSSSPSGPTPRLFTRRRRAFVACANCRKRKMKCTTVADGNSMPCRRCALKGLKCEYLAVDESCPPPTTVACASCRKSKIKCATVSDGDCRPCTQCKQRGLECEYAPPEDYSPQYSTGPLGGAEEYSDYYGWVPRPITAPSAPISTYLSASPPSSRTLSPTSHGGSYAGAPDPMLMVSTPSRPISERPPFRTHTHPHSFAYSAPTQYRHLAPVPGVPPYYRTIAPHPSAPDPIDFVPLFDPLYGEYAHDGYVHEVQRRASYPSTWPQSIYTIHDPPYHNPNFNAQ
ncbi:hypothetical protein DFH06DRAFT_1332666 [Mycena polygramma]|nr:hypothetical protein DFH06DRAFT_1332666 [Mycena polygramma]